MASQAVADTSTSQDDYRRSKQLQEARAAGTAAPEMDAATGKMINPHNPQFITQAPWYLNQSKPSLSHQQAWNMKANGNKDWYKRGTKGDVKTKFLKGACQNCGATTHQINDCVERPRKVGAKFNGKNLMPDEHIEDIRLDYEGKRDRWNGFQPDDYKEVIEEWEKVEAERRKVKAAQMEERAKIKEKLKNQKRALKKKRRQRRRQLRRQAEGLEDCDDSDTGCDSDTDTDTDSDSEASDDEDLGEKLKDFDKTTATTAARDDKLRTTTRNLRIREDTAKYLLNLDVNSSFYDPKSRSMRQNPLAHLKDEEQGSFRGDNFVRHTGDSRQLTELTLFAWDAYKHGEKVHDFAQPTQALKMFQVFKNRSKDLKETQQQELMEKYGGEEHKGAPPELLFSQNDNYVEYSRDGRIIKGREPLLQKSKYEEDILVGNHSSPWGSWYCTNTGRWGFACCHQTMKNAYCLPIKSGGAVASSSSLTDAAATRSENAIAATQKETHATHEANPLIAKDTGAAEPASAAIEQEETAKAKTKADKKAEKLATKAAAASSSSSCDSDGSESGSASSSSSGSSSSSSAGAESKAQAKAAKKAAKDPKAPKKAAALKGLKLGGNAEEAAKSGDEDKEAAKASKLSDRRSSAFGHNLEDATEFDAAKVAEALEREKKRRKKEDKKKFTLDDERNRKFNSLAGDTMGELSPEEFEAYRLTKVRSDDPMASFI